VIRSYPPPPGPPVTRLGSPAGHRPPGRQLGAGHPGSGCSDCWDSSVVARYTDVRTYVSRMLRQCCHPEVPYLMHIAGAIALTPKALPCAKVMITQMGFHAMPAGVSRQGRAAQLVNPLSACSLFDVLLMTSGGTKSQVAGCSGRATRRSGRDRRHRPGPARAGRGREDFPAARRAGVSHGVHGHWLAWTALCAVGGRPQAGRPACGGPPRGAAAPRPQWRVGAGYRPPGPAASRSHPVSGRSWRVPAGTPGIVRPAPVNSTEQYLRRGICVDVFKIKPLFRAGPCTCSTQFTYHSAVGVFQ
jgi:hypothetical protein